MGKRPLDKSGADVSWRSVGCHRVFMTDSVCGYPLHWRNCYKDTYDLWCPESYAHPALTFSMVGCIIHIWKNIKRVSNLALYVELPKMLGLKLVPLVQVEAKLVCGTRFWKPALPLPAQAVLVR